MDCPFQSTIVHGKAFWITGNKSVRPARWITCNKWDLFERTIHSAQITWQHIGWSTGGPGYMVCRLLKFIAALKALFKPSSTHLKSHCLPCHFEAPLIVHAGTPRSHLLCDPWINIALHCTWHVSGRKPQFAFKCSGLLPSMVRFLVDSFPWEDAAICLHTLRATSTILCNSVYCTHGHTTTIMFSTSVDEQRMPRIGVMVPRLGRLWRSSKEWTVCNGIHADTFYSQLHSVGIDAKEFHRFLRW